MCIFAVGPDEHRKYAQRQAEQELASAHQLLDKILESFNISNIIKLAELLLNIL